MITELKLNYIVLVHPCAPSWDEANPNFSHLQTLFQPRNEQFALRSFCEFLHFTSERCLMSSFQWSEVRVDLVLYYLIAFVIWTCEGSAYSGLVVVNNASDNSMALH